ncbi:MAG: DUF3604 domain-containing protein, partial [Bradymonadaceae bacterium]
GTESRPGTLLQQIQIVEGTVGPAGEASVEVHTVAGDPDNGASVDPDTCETTGQGFDTLCATWTDEEFDASKRHFYYARVLENPSCRWSTYQCNALEEGERPAVCDSREVPETIQERAWTSPIWVEPGAE